MCVCMCVSQPELDPYDNPMVMSLREFTRHPIAKELLHNGQTFQVCMCMYMCVRVCVAIGLTEHTERRQMNWRARSRACPVAFYSPVLGCCACVCVCVCVCVSCRCSASQTTVTGGTPQRCDHASGRTHTHRCVCVCVCLCLCVCVCVCVMCPCA